MRVFPFEVGSNLSRHQSRWLRKYMKTRIPQIKAFERGTGTSHSLALSDQAIRTRENRAALPGPRSPVAGRANNMDQAVAPAPTSASNLLLSSGSEESGGRILREKIDSVVKTPKNNKELLERMIERDNSTGSVNPERRHSEFPRREGYGPPTAVVPPIHPDFRGELAKTRRRYNRMLRHKAKKQGELGK